MDYGFPFRMARRAHTVPDLKPQLAESEGVLSLLAETPRRIAAAAAGHSAAELALPLATGEWSAVQILAHLRGCADVWPATIYAMLRADNPVLPLHAPREWARKKGYARLDFYRSFQVFIQEREELLRVLTGLPPASWLRGAQIGGRRHTVFSQARRLALHEEVHCAQFEALSGG
jgi:hypothetical protein